MEDMNVKKCGEPGSAKGWISAHPIFGYDAERIAAGDKLDADWREAVRQARAKVCAEWKGDPNDVVGKLRAEMPLIPPWPPGFEERRRTCNRCGSRIEYDPDHDALFC